MTDTKGQPAGNPLRELNHTIGDRTLCAWLVAKGVCWVQTRDPIYYDRLRQRKDSRLVARGVLGGYLRTFEVLKPLRRVVALLRRYTRPENPVPAKHKCSPECPPAVQGSGRGSMSGGAS